MSDFMKQFSLEGKVFIAIISVSANITIKIQSANMCNVKKHIDGYETQ